MKWHITILYGLIVIFSATALTAAYTEVFNCEELEFHGPLEIKATFTITDALESARSGHRTVDGRWRYEFRNTSSEKNLILSAPPLLAYKELSNKRFYATSSQELQIFFGLSQDVIIPPKSVEVVEGPILTLHTSSDSFEKLVLVFDGNGSTGDDQNEVFAGCVVIDPIINDLTK